MKRIFAIILVFLLVVIAFYGCGSGNINEVGNGNENIAVNESASGNEYTHENENMYEDEDENEIGRDQALVGTWTLSVDSRNFLTFIFNADGTSSTVFPDYVMTDRWVTMEGGVILYSGDAPSESAIAGVRAYSIAGNVLTIEGFPDVMLLEANTLEGTWMLDLSAYSEGIQADMFTLIFHDDGTVIQNTTGHIADLEWAIDGDELIIYLTDAQGGMNIVIRWTYTLNGNNLNLVNIDDDEMDFDFVRVN